MESSNLYFRATEIKESSKLEILSIVMKELSKNSRHWSPPLIMDNTASIHALYAKHGPLLVKVWSALESYVSYYNTYVVAINSIEKNLLPPTIKFLESNNANDVNSFLQQWLLFLQQITNLVNHLLTPLMRFDELSLEAEDFDRKRREEVGKLQENLSITAAKCNHEYQKRDEEIDRLKKIPDFLLDMYGKGDDINNYRNQRDFFRKKIEQIQSDLQEIAEYEKFISVIWGYIFNTPYTKRDMREVWLFVNNELSEFIQWLMNLEHNRFERQIMFMGFKGFIEKWEQFAATIQVLWQK